MNMKKLRHHLIVGLLLALPQWLWAQSGTISGKITNAADEEPLVGATVQVKGTTIGTATDIRGQYQLTGVPVGKSVMLIIRSIGFKEKEVAVSLVANETKTFDFSLESADLYLEDIVVTGLAVQTKQKELGTSRANVSSRTLDELPIPTVEDALIGRLAGVETYSADGAPGGGFRFRMRGGNSIIGASEPLVIVDGIFLDNSNRNVTTGANAVNGTGSASFGMNNGTRALAAINPEDIESIEVLKGAAAASLYGSRASSGVIVIKTKSGGGGQPTFEYSLDAGVTQVHRGVLNYKKDWTPEQVRTWANLVNEAQTGAAIARRYTAAEIEQFAQQSNLGNDWMTAAFRQGSFSRHTFRVSGGDNKLSYYASASTQNNIGHQKGTEFSANGFRVSVTSRPTTKFEIRVNADYSADKRKQLPGGAPGFFIVNAWGRNSNAMPFMNLDQVRSPGQAARTDLGIPSPDAYTTIRRENDIQRIIGSVNAKYNITQNLIVDANLGIDNSTIDGKMIYPFGVVSIFPTGRLDIDKEVLRQTTFTLGLNHAWEINKDLYVKSAAGLQYDENLRTYLYARFQNRVPTVDEQFLGGYQTFNAGSNFELRTPVNTLGIYFNETIGYKDKIFVNLGGRFDRGTAFREQFFFYPRASVSYNIKDNIRARAAVGTSGTQPPPFAINPTFGLDPGGYNGASAINYLTPGNNNLKPETQIETEIGIDGSLLKGRLNFELTFYNKQFRDLLLNSGVNPAINRGFTENLINVGEMYNRGFEIAINGDILRTKDLTWNLGFTGTTLDNKVTSLNIAAQPGQTPQILGGLLSVARIKEGYPLSGLWTPTATGQDIYLGSPFAKFDFNINTQVDYKGLFARVLFGGKSGMKRFNGTARDLAAPGTRMHDELWDRSAAELNAPAAQGGILNDFSRWVQDASFTKLRFLTVGYNMPKSMVSKLPGGFVKKLTVSLTGANLLTFSKYKGGYDIESETSGAGQQNAWVRGIDFWEAGIPRSYTFSLNVGF
jgi:TonB-linked SusC/RagA family outer membrane protein